MQMKCEISIDSEKLEKFIGRKMAQKEFADFCRNAVVGKLWEQQITNKSSRPANCAGS